MSLLFGTILSCQAAGIYKWVDEKGQVHFSQTKPNQQEASRVGETLQSDHEVPAVPAIGRCTTLSQQLVGDWRGKDRQQRIVFRFYERDDYKFAGSLSNMAYMIDYGRQGLLQGGHWKVKGNSIVFSIRKRGRSAGKRAEFTRAALGRIDVDNLVLLVGNATFRLARYTGSGNLPTCMRRKRNR